MSIHAVFAGLCLLVISNAVHASCKGPPSLALVQTNFSCAPDCLAVLSGGNTRAPDGGVLQVDIITEASGPVMHGTARKLAGEVAGTRGWLVQADGPLEAGTRYTVVQLNNDARLAPQEENPPPRHPMSVTMAKHQRSPVSGWPCDDTPGFPFPDPPAGDPGPMRDDVQIAVNDEAFLERPFAYDVWVFDADEAAPVTPLSPMTPPPASLVAEMVTVENAHMADNGDLMFTTESLAQIPILKPGTRVKVAVRRRYSAAEASEVAVSDVIEIPPADEPKSSGCSSTTAAPSLIFLALLARGTKRRRPTLNS